MGRQPLFDALAAPGSMIQQRLPPVQTDSAMPRVRVHSPDRAARVRLVHRRTQGPRRPQKVNVEAPLQYRQAVARAPESVRSPT